MATYTLANLQTDIRNYTEVGSTVLSDTILERLITNAEQTIFRAVDMDDERFYATSNCIIGNRYVSIPADCRVIRYVQLLNDNVSDISAAAGFTITVGKKNSDGSVTAAAGTLGEPENYFYFTSTSTATNGSINGGGSNTSAGPVTLSVVNA